MARIEPIYVKNLLTLARAYAEHNEMKLATVSRYFHGTSTLFGALEEGKEVSLTFRKYDEMVAAFKERWPKDLAWPRLKVPARARA